MSIDTLIGKTLTNITVADNQEVVLFETDVEAYRMYHSQDCCESVYLSDITGDLRDLIGTPILMAYEASNNSEVTKAQREVEQWCDSETWTFYHLATIKGYVTLRWIGSSNGYYSESVEFEKVS